MFVDAFYATLGVLVACTLFALAVAVLVAGCAVIGVMWKARNADDDGDEAF